MNQFYPPPSTLPPGSKVVAYLRDSGGSDQEDSVERQEQELARWCLRYGLELTQLFTDAARTARRDLHKRKDLLSMMAHFRDGGGEAGVIIWNYERFARNIKHGRAFISELEAMNKVLVSLTDNIPEGPERFLFQDLKLYSAEMTSAKISIDVTSGLRRLVEVHGAMPGKPPRGFRRGEPIQIGTHRDGSPRIVHRWEPDPDQIEAVRTAFEMRARGETLKNIMRATKVFPTINSFKSFFGNRLYMGELHYGDMVIEDYCPPIVLPALWQTANDVCKSRSRLSEENNPRRIASNFLLSGVIYCQYCGSPMNGHIKQYGNGGPRYEYYICSRKMRRRDCPSLSVQRLPLETEVLRVLEERSLQLDLLLSFQVSIEEKYKKLLHQNSKELRRLRQKQSAAQKRIHNLTDAIAENGGSKSLFNALQSAEADEAALRVKIAQLEISNPPTQYQPPQLAEMAEGIKSILRGNDFDLKQKAARSLITRLVVARHRARIDGVLYYLPLQLSEGCLGKSAPMEIRTPVLTLKGLCPGPLDDGGGAC